MKAMVPGNNMFGLVMSQRPSGGDMKLQIAFIFLVVCSWSSFSNAQPASATSNPLHREYREGERLAYHMKALNEAWHYEINEDGVVKKDAAGRFFEDYAWTHMTSGGQPVSLAASAGDYRQKLTCGAAKRHEILRKIELAVEQ